MIHKPFWILYDDIDYPKNQAFAALLAQEGEALGLESRIVLTGSLRCCLTDGQAALTLGGQALQAPWFVINRSRSPLLLHQLEAMGVAVYNSAFVAEQCDDKRRTHQLLARHGVPMMDTVFLNVGDDAPQSGYPFVIKPACSHGGDRVRLVSCAAQWEKAVNAIWPQPAIQQRPASELGLDKRVYVLFGKPIAAVMRKAADGFLSNFSMGGSVSLSAVTAEEQSILDKVLEALPLALAGVDFLYDQGRPVLSEVEDAVGCRMLYQLSDMNIAGMYLKELAKRHPPLSKPF